MPFIEWNNSLSVSVAGIDGQHKRLVEMINELNDAMAAGKGKEVLGKILGGLIQYAVQHFATEERYFDKFGYEDSAAHKKEHQAFAQKVGEFKAQFDQGAVGLSIQIMTFLKDWLKNHITVVDKKYSACFNANGLR